MSKYKKKTDNPNMGRPEIEIDWEEFEKLCQMQCTLIEIADWFKCSDDTIENRVKDEYNDTFSGVFKRLSSKGKRSLRRNQFNLSIKSAAMAIFLGKQYLGQKDRQELDMNHNHTGPAHIVFTDNSYEKIPKE